MWLQKKIQLKPRHRGFHLITDELLSAMGEIRGIKVGILQVFIQHCSASLTINENADPTVRQDFEQWFNRAIPDASSYFKHDYEGDDDMPAHIKASILGASIMVPIADGELQLGTWQGIYLGEHRNQASARTLILTLNGE